MHLRDKQYGRYKREHVFTRGHPTKWKHYISATTMLMVTRLIRVVTYRKEPQLINSDDTSMMWLCEVIWQIEYTVSPPTEDPWKPNRYGADLHWEAPIFKATWPFKAISLIFEHVTNVRSRDNLKNLYFHYQKSYDQ